MSKYTTQVRFICEQASGLDESKGYNDVNEVIANARTKIFNFNYPIFDDNYKSVIETKILKHFYTREIGAETVGLWKLWLDTKMNEIMPYYNKMYESARIDFNPLFDVDLTTTHSGSDGGQRNDTGNSNNTRANTGDSETTTVAHDTDSRNHWNYYNDTPQGGINGLESLTYLTNATHDTDSGSENRNSTTNNEYTDNVTETGTTSLASTYSNTDEYVEHVTGKRGGQTYSKMIKEFREILINIDMLVIHELDDLFFNLW